VERIVLTRADSVGGEEEDDEDEWVQPGVTEGDALPAVEQPLGLLPPPLSCRLLIVGFGCGGRGGRVLQAVWW